MNCGRCGEAMEQGRVEVHSSAFAFSLLGNSMQDLYWYDEKNQRKSRRRIIDSETGKPAFGCKKCGLITIDTTQPSVAAARGRRAKRRKKQ